MFSDINTAETKRRVRLFWLVGCASLALAVLVLAATSWTVYSNWSESHDDAMRAQSNRVYLRNLNNLLSELEDAESGQRGFLITGLARYLEPYNRALKPVSKSIGALSQIAIERTDKAKEIAHLRAVVDDKLREMALVIHLKQTQGDAVAKAAIVTDRGLTAMNEIRRICKTEGDVERADVERRTDDSERHQLVAIRLAAAGSGLILCLMIGGFFALTSSAAQQSSLAERLADSRDIFETTLTSIGDGVIATDTSGLIKFLNPEAVALTGWCRADAIDKDLDEIFPILNETTREKVESPYTRVMRTGSATSRENPAILLRRDGSEVPIEGSGAPIQNIHGETKGVVLVFRGIEQRRKAEAALELSHSELLKANEELRQFSYAATHDLQEPLRTIVVFSQLVGRNYKSMLDERGQNMLRTLEDAGQRMSSLINDLLAFTRVGYEDSSNTPSAVDANDILNDTLVQLNGAISETNASIYRDHLPHVWSEPAQLSQVFQNLISNAIKYRKPDVPPVIRITSTVADDFAMFNVTDNGIGLKQEYADKIFRLFQRLHGRSIPGTGIGLALCRRIVERQGGKIWAISEENRGSSFFFTLPVAQQGGPQKQLLPQ